MNVVKPTVIGGGASNSPPAAAPAPATAPASTTLPVAAENPLANFPVALEPAERAMVQQKAASVSITGVTLQQIATMESAPEQALNGVLNGFLAKIDVFDNPNLFKLVKQLGVAVDQEKLPALTERILDHKPGALEKFGTFLMSKKAREKALESFWEETQSLVKGSSAKLKKVVDDMERSLHDETNKLLTELQTMDQLKENYIGLFRDFAVAVAFMQVFLQQAKAELAQREAAADPGDQTAQAELLDIRDKVQALESRALALEGTMTRLPADSMVIRQLQSAGISTLQEVSTTALGRFISIKQTIVTLNTTMAIKSVQKVSEAGKALDENLAKVRGEMMKDVVSTAANAPGDNRVAQAQQIQAIITQTGELMQIVDAAQETNAQKFGEARSMFDNARQEMLALGRGKPSA